MIVCAHNLSLMLPAEAKTLTSAILLLFFLLVETHGHLWAPGCHERLVELIQVNCITLVHCLWCDGWQELVVMWSHIREEGCEAGCHLTKGMVIMAMLPCQVRNQIAHH